MHDNRLTQRLTNYWQQLRKSDSIPDFTHFDAAAIQDVWPRCFLLKISASQKIPLLYTYEYVGEEIKKAYGRDLTGVSLSSRAKEFPGTRILQRIDEIARKPEPINDEGQFISDKHHVVKYRACLLPFGGNNHSVSHIIAGLSWREFA